MLEVDAAPIICDICGRTVEHADPPDRLQYCPSCQRFACRLCWVATANACRQCLLGGAGQNVTGRLRPQIAETFTASSIQRERRQPTGSVQPATTPSAAAAVPPDGTEGRSRAIWVVLIAAVIVAALYAAATSPNEGQLGGTPPSTTPPTVSTPPAKATPSPQPLPPKTYVVRRGDTLTEIAERVYGDGTLWRRIYRANRDQLDQPDQLRVGQTLVIPRR